MDALIEGFKVFAPIVLAIFTVIAFVWKVPSKNDMQKGDDALRALLNNLSDRIDANSRTTHAEITKLNDKMDANARTTHVDITKLNDKVDANARTTHAEITAHNDKMAVNFQTVYDKMDANFRTVNDKMDANFQTVYADLRTLNDKIESYSQATYERIDKATAELRTDIKTLNQNYIDHLARHEEQALKARETHGD